MSTESAVEPPVDPASGREIPPSVSSHTCPWLVQYLLLSPLRRLMERPRDLLGPHVRPGMVVAEPGCGLGAFSLDLAEMVGPSGKVLCVDIEPRAVERLVRRAARRGLAERIAAAACEPDRLGLDEWRGKVDLVVLMHVLHEVPDQIGLLEQARDLLKPGGKLLLCEPPHRYVGERSYQWELARCRAVGFEEEEIPGRARPRRALFAWRPPR